MPEPIRVAHLITSLDVGGTELFLQRLVTRSDARAFRHVVAVLKPAGPVADGLAAAGVPVSSFDLHGLPSLVAVVPRVAAWLRRVRPDVLQTWLYHADLVGSLAARAGGAPPVLWNLRTADDRGIYRRSTRAVRWLCARASRHAEAIVVNSAAGLAFHAALGYAPGRWAVIPNGVDTDAFRPDAAARNAVRAELGLPRETILVGLVARFDPTKGHELFLDAAAWLAARRADVRFVLAGPGVTGANDALRSGIARRRLEGRVHLLGPRRDVARVTAALDLASLCSKTEGMPNVLLEALSCAVPCVATDVGDTAALVGDAGTIVATRDAETFATAWLDWLERGGEERRRRGEAARARIAASYGLCVSIGAYEALYAEVAGARAAAGAPLRGGRRAGRAD